MKTMMNFALKKIALVFFCCFFFFTTVSAQVFDPSKIRLFWKDASGNPYLTFEQLVRQHPKLKFAMNAGMFTPQYAPVGLYVEGGKQLRKLKLLNNPKVNFGIQPQGVFCIRKNKAFIYPANASFSIATLDYATQSGPILVIDGVVNPKLPKGQLLLRNGVGIRKDGKVYFACKEMNFLDFARHFIENECIMALYLDGFVSEVWTPGKQTMGNFGPMIGVY